MARHPTLTPRGLFSTLLQSPLLHPHPPQCLRTYQSYAHPLASPFPAPEKVILAAALTHVPAHGFTPTALTLGARDAGYIDASANLFPAGPFDLVRYHLVTQRLALARSQSLADQPSSVGAEVRRLTWTRLLANAPVVHRWQEVCQIMIPPHPSP